MIGVFTVMLVTLDNVIAFELTAEPVTPAILFGVHARSKLNF